MKLIPDLCRQRAALSPEALAFVDLANGREWRFSDVDRRASRCAGWLRARGLAPGARVAVLCQNTPLFFELLFAVARAGLTLVPLNWRQTVAELGPVLADSGAGLLLHDAGSAALAGALGLAGGVPLHALEALDPVLDEAGESLPATAWESDAAWYLLYTSGTTGKPKAVIQTAGMALANAVNITLATGIDASTKALNFLPLFHTAGINLHTLPVFFAGGVSRVLPKFEADAVLGLIDARQLTIFFGVPQIYQLMSLSPAFAGTDLAAVRHWGCGGAPLSAALINEFMARGVAICNGMGMTETGPTVFFMDPANAARKIGSVGKPQLLAEVRLVNEAGEDADEGELLFRGPGITPGYFGNPEATQAAFAPGGWLKSGDVGRRDAEGYYFIVDRIKDMYISGGENVYPAEVERALLAHPAVLEVAVLGVPDTRWGEVGHAAITLRPGGSADVETLRAYARSVLAAYKVPKFITLVPDFPRTAAGKVQKHVLRALLEENRT